MSDSVDVAVRALASGGAGVADLPDGRVVFVQRTAPGDRARIRVTRSRARWAEGELLELLEPSGDRVDPPCALYDLCGGCRLQHVGYDVQVAWKSRFVQDALERIGGLSDVETPPMVASPEELRYRSRVSFTLRRLRGGRVVAGFHALDRPAHVVDVDGQCLLPEPEVAAAWQALRRGWGTGASRLPTAGRLRLTLRRALGGVELLVEGGHAGWDPAPLRERVAALTAVWHRPGSADAEAELVAGVEGEGGGTAFEQVNRGAAELLRAHVLGQIRAVAPDAGRGVDAYCGSGVYGRALAEMGWAVVGIESDPVAVAEASEGAPEGFRVVTGTVEATLEDALPADLVVANPPRSGLGADVTDRLAASPPAHLVYVSCDPATLARDLRALAHHFTIQDVTGFDLFPQTAHVETVVVLRRKNGEEPAEPQGEAT